MADELPPVPEGPPPAPAAPPPPPAGRSRVILLSLALLYASSLGAAYVLSMRKTPSKGDGMTLLKSKTPKIGWIRISGPIYDSDSSGFIATGVRAWVKDLRKFAERDEVKAIVLEINSPGGSVGAIQEVHSHVRRVRAESKKPIIAVMGDVAASGGYYIAAACDKIVAHPGTITGSIGVIFQTSNLETLMGKIGVEFGNIKSGKHKDIGSPFRPMTPEERKLLQSMIDDAYAQFLKAVSEGRKIPEEKLTDIADGRIFTGRQALESGLVDKLGDSYDAKMLAGELGGIKGEPKVVGADEPFEDLLRLLEGRSGGSWLSRAAAATNPGLAYLWKGF